MSARYFLSRQNIVRTIILFTVFVFAGGLVVYTRQQNDRNLQKLPEKSTALPSAKWFVSPKGNDRNTGGSPGLAFASIQKAVEVAKPGEAIKLEDGTYKQSFHYWKLLCNLVVHY